MILLIDNYDGFTGNHAIDKATRGLLELQAEMLQKINKHTPGEIVSGRQ